MKSTARAVSAVMLIMLFSKLMSLLSNILYVTFFGINLKTDIYSYATQLPNIIFTCLGTAIVTVVIPIFAGYIGTGEKEKAFRFANDISGIAIIFTTILTIAGIVFAPYILSLTRFKENGFAFALISLRIMFPAMVFYALNFILQGVLQSLGRYLMPAAVSLPSSLTVIAYILLLGNKYGISGLVIATLIGLALQALILIPPSYRAGYRFIPSFGFKSDDVKRALKLVPPVLLGTCAYQVNMLFSTTLAANFKDAVALMATAQNLVLYFALTFVYSITAVVFPKLTMLAARNDMEGFKNNLLKVLKLIIFILVPSAAGLIVVKYRLVDFLYGWGKFTSGNVLLGGDILALYSIGIVGVGIKEVIDRAFYSIKDTMKPAYGSVFVMAVNVAASIALVLLIGVKGIPLAYSISALAGAVLLTILMRKKIGSFGGRILLFSTFKVLISSVIMLMAVAAIDLAVGNAAFTGQAMVDKGLRLFIPVIAGFFIYMSTGLFLKNEETVEAARRLIELLKHFIGWVYAGKKEGYR